jgi:hypothetical protein
LGKNKRGQRRGLKRRKMRYINLPVLAQAVGAAVFGITVWKGVHGVFPTVGLLSGAGMVYAGKHFASLFKG